MDEKQTAALLEKVQSTINDSKAIADLKADLANLKEGAITPDSFKESLDKFAEEHGVAGLKENLDKVALELKKLQEAGPKKEKGLREMLVEKADEMKEISNGKKTSFTLDNVKTTVQRSAVADHTLAFRLTDIGQLATRGTVIANQFRQATIGPNNNGTIRYVDWDTATRNAAMTAEAGTYPQSAATWAEYNLPIEKLTDSIPVTHESLMDIDFIDSEIRRLLEINMTLLEDTQVYSGDGTPPNLVGAYPTAATFSSTTPKIVDASIYDLLNLLQTELANGKESKYMASAVLMNPTDILKMTSKKDANFNYVLPPFVSADGSVVAAMQIVPSATVTTNTLLMGDFRYGTYYTSEGFEIEVGWVANQFIQDIMTLKARKRSALLIRNADEEAFTKVTDITAAVAAITG